jgi:hypothetical protein
MSQDVIDTMETSFKKLINLATERLADVSTTTHILRDYNVSTRSC